MLAWGVLRDTLTKTCPFSRYVSMCATTKNCTKNDVGTGYTLTL